MKKPGLLLVTLWSLSVHAETPESVVGHYESSAPLSCNLVVELTHTNDVGEYRVTTNNRSESGRFSLEGQYIRFAGLFAAEPGGSKELVVSALLSNDSLTIQNYGNSMNPYNLFPECGPKYITLDKAQ